MNIENLFGYIDGYTEGGDDLPDGAFWQLHVEAVDSYNEENGTSYDWYEIHSEYIDWHNLKFRE